MLSTPLTLITNSPAQTAAAGEALGRLLHRGDVVLLEGFLGTGKTCFTQGLAKGMGLSAAVTSPTFILVNHYRGPVPLFHIDLYRISNPVEADDLGLDDYFFDDGVCVVEWPDCAPQAMPPERLHLRFEHAGDLDRRITSAAQGDRYERLLNDFGASLAHTPELAGSVQP